MNKRYYLAAFTVPISGFYSLTQEGWMSYFAVMYAFLIVPFLELLIGPNAKNLSPETEQVAKNDSFFDGLLYLMLPIQYALLVYFLYALKGTSDLIPHLGHIASMGVMCGVIGINVAHELGHRPKKLEQNMAKALLLSSLYMHFFIEHNRGHHKQVSTYDDPATARLNEPIYLFWPRAIVMGWISAFRLEKKRLHQQQLSAWNWRNEHLQFQFIQLGLMIMIAVFAGFWAVVGFVLAALVGILLLETVNYIEHYGLSRLKTESGLYERVKSTHSWNSNHVLGRTLLFELTRHSDHHYLASKKYQLLKHHDDSPQMPTGYPGMMLLSLVPPLWFAVMNPRINQNGEAKLNASPST